MQVAKALTYPVICRFPLSVITIHLYTSQTDRQTDGRTDGRTDVAVIQFEMAQEREKH